MIINRPAKESIYKYLDGLKADIESRHGLDCVRYVDLGVKTVRVLNHCPELTGMMARQLGWSLRDSADSYDATVVLWKTDEVRTEDGDMYWVMDESYSKISPVVVFNAGAGSVTAYDDRSSTYYFGVWKTEPEEFLKQGHMFVQIFYRILKGPCTSLVHGACVGVDGKGVLLCARGQRGKSTLTVLSLLKGFEYVSDDYLVLERKGRDLLAYPIYSIITLSPGMYNELFDELEGTRFISNNARKDKYVLGIANCHDRFRAAYPVRLCMYPEIVSDPDPEVVPCDAREKGVAITNMIHSTITQMMEWQDSATVLKISNMLRGFEFYKIRLCRDIRRNVECLREFLRNYDTQKQ